MPLSKTDTHDDICSAAIAARAWYIGSSPAGSAVARVVISVIAGRTAVRDELQRGSVALRLSGRCGDVRPMTGDSHRVDWWWRREHDAIRD